MRSAIRVLVVDDSALIRQMLTRVLSLDPRIEVVGIAKTGIEAIEKARELSPDVVTLDIEMPELNGIEALPHIRHHSDARVIMLSSIDDSDTTFKALSMGAVDFIPKPTAGMAGSLTELSELLLKKIKIAYRVDPLQVGAVQAALGGSREADGAAPAPHASDSGPLACVSIAASTGGPPALERVFSGLAASMPAVYLIVQHLPPRFSASLARRLSSAGDVPVVEAEHGMSIEPGHGYIAPHGYHMVVHRTAAGTVQTEFRDGPSINGVRPAADPLFESNAAVFGEHSIGVVLTGMGSDGARGAAAIKRAGGYTVAQDEATSVVFGMPAATIRMAAASRVVSIGLVAAEIRRSIRLRAEAASA